MDPFLTMTEDTNIPNKPNTPLQQWWDSDAHKQLQEASEAYELLGLLNGDGQPYEDVIKEREYYESSSQYTEEELDAMCDAATSAKKDKVNKWILPVDDDYNITFPEDLLEQTGWKEGDTLQWIDQGDGSFKIIKKGN